MDSRQGRVLVPTDDVVKTLDEPLSILNPVCSADGGDNSVAAKADVATQASEDVSARELVVGVAAR